MTLVDFNTSVQDLRILINNHNLAYNNDSGRRISKFFIFDIDYRTSSFGIWNVMTKNVVAYVNPTKKVVYVRRNSIYADAIARMKGWTVVKSDKLRRLNNRNSHNSWYTRFYGKPQGRAINELTEPTDFVIDLGHDETRRQTIIANIHGQMVRGSDRVAVAAAATGNYPRRRITVRLGPEPVVETPAVSEASQYVGPDSFPYTVRDDDAVRDYQVYEDTAAEYIGDRMNTIRPSAFMQEFTEAEPRQARWEVRPDSVDIRPRVHSVRELADDITNLPF